jgi:hypothetical protein
MEREVIMVVVISLAALAMMGSVVFVIMQARKFKYLRAQSEFEKRFEQEISKSEMEIREQSLKNMTWELHDYVGQLLSVARMQLSIIQPAMPGEYHERFTEINKLIGDSLHEIRSMSRTLKPEVMDTQGLSHALQVELDRFMKLNFLETQFVVSGEEVELEHSDTVIIFRILQEFFLNVVKHSKASKLFVSVDYSENRLRITASDNGIGFDQARIHPGTGLHNMNKRAELIGALITLKAFPRGGVTLSLEYPYKKIAYAS